MSLFFCAYSVSFFQTFLFFESPVTVFVTLHNTHIVLILRGIVTNLFQDGTILVRLIIFVVSKLYILLVGGSGIFLSTWIVAVQEVYCCNTGGILLEYGKCLGVIREVYYYNTAL